MCDRPATSLEHVPPKCIFPERKDLNCGDLRVQLITVPSCDIHNSKKSKDDEFLMVSLAGIIGNNSIGYRHKFTKVNRAIRNTCGRLLNAAFLSRKHFVVKYEKNAYVELIRGTPDYERLNTCFDQIARGLHRYHFGTRFQGITKVILGYIVHAEPYPKTFGEFLKHRFEIDLRGKPMCGANPRVFYYQFSERDQIGVFSLKMCFYEGAEIFVAFQPDGVKVPANLGMMLMEGGFKTIVELEGKKYEFN
jgi:hypothetical protein